MKIRLTKGYVATVDKTHYADLSRFKWTAQEYKNKKGKVIIVYAYRQKGTPEGVTKIFMHRAVMNVLKSSIRIDHRDHNGLNNRRQNLRRASASQNQINGPAISSNTSGFRGVTWDKDNRKWKAQITKDGRNHYLGLFDNRRQAATAYKQAARRIFGEFAPWAS